MKVTIVQEVREARAAVAADFDYDLHKFFAWAKARTAAEAKAKHRLPARPQKESKPAVIPKRPLRSTASRIKTPARA